MAVPIFSFPIRTVKRRRLILPPAAGTPRIAQVTLPGSLFENARYFAPRRGSGLEQFAPEIVIGSASHLATLSQAVEAREIDLSSLSLAIYSITTCRDVPLRRDVRFALWQSFGVPVYEVLLDGDHLPIATECDAHEGWHIDNAVTFANGNGQLWFRRKREAAQGTGLRGRIEAEPCACGRPGRRILDPELDFFDPLRLRPVNVAC